MQPRLWIILQPVWYGHRYLPTYVTWTITTVTPKTKRQLLALALQYAGLYLDSIRQHQLASSNLDGLSRITEHRCGSSRGSAFEGPARGAHEPLRGAHFTVTMNRDKPVGAT